MIEARQLHKRFGSLTAVEEVSFQADDGRITGLLGPNGAGKTTSIRMLTGLLRPDRGSATVGGVDVAREPEAARRKLGVLPDAPGLYARLTAREHLVYAGRLQGLAGRDLERSVDGLIERLGMQGIAGRRAAGFSQGERRKVALARTLVHDPQHVLLDEPTNGLDVVAARAVRQEIRGLAEAGRCVVFSSHVMSEVAALCDRIVIVARGRVVAAGTVSELKARAGREDLEDAFIQLIGDGEGLQ